MMKNRHFQTAAKYQIYWDGKYWTVLEGQKPLYDHCSGYDEAVDLAWAWNAGALSDQEAVDMIILRDGCIPEWLA